MKITETLADAFTAEQKRVRELLVIYKGIGPAGTFGIAMIEQILQRADEVAIEGDPVTITRTYNELKNCD